MNNTFKAQNFIKDIVRDFEKKDKEVRLKAGRYVQGKMIEKITRSQSEQVSAFVYKGSKPGEAPGMFTGNLSKGIKVQNGEYDVKVGAVAPAYHATLLEFGTRNRVSAKGNPNNMKARPFLNPTFEEEKEKIIDILSEERV